MNNNGCVWHKLATSCSYRVETKAFIWGFFFFLKVSTLFEIAFGLVIFLSKLEVKALVTKQGFI